LNYELLLIQTGIDWLLSNLGQIQYKTETLDLQRKKRTIIREMRTIKPLDALFGVTRQKVLSRTHLQPERWWYLHELARSLGLRPSSIQREVAALVAAGILSRRENGNRVYFKADTACPIFPDIQNLLIKTVALADVLKDALEPLRSSIQIAFIYGSIASSEERSASDVDLMIIGSARLSDLAPALRKVEPQLGRTVNPTMYEPREFVNKLKAGNNFLKNVAVGRKLFLLGTENDLAKLTGERTDKAAHD
jgi:predicted nucleotidyltransferase